MSVPLSPRWREPLRAVALGAAVVLVLGLWVYPVTSGGDSPAGPIQNDAAHYLAMARGSLSDAPAPFAFRIGVPLLARVLPVAPEVTFRGQCPGARGGAAASGHSARSWLPRVGGARHEPQGAGPHLR